ncbi:hypothetical protein [Rubrivivax gelatinosus]|uniref:hypothetical protein n=1 Tax=Rubrivivax gelatinosus TaxID=28068 RepID=UPI0018CAAACA|nr:hypothetical protein [Rubrivivax gelatinosus]
MNVERPGGGQGGELPPPTLIERNARRMVQTTKSHWAVLQQRRDARPEGEK